MGRTYVYGAFQQVPSQIYAHQYPLSSFSKAPKITKILGILDNTQSMTSFSPLCSLNSLKYAGNENYLFISKVPDYYFPDLQIGNLYATGSNIYNYGVTSDTYSSGKFDRVSTDTPLQSFTENNSLLGWENVTIGAFHALAKSSSSLFKSGQNTHGQLGDNRASDYYEFFTVVPDIGPIRSGRAAPQPSDAVRRSVAGIDFSIITDLDGKVRVAGRNDYNQLGLPNSFTSTLSNGYWSALSSIRVWTEIPGYLVNNADTYVPGYIVNNADGCIAAGDFHSLIINNYRNSVHVAGSNNWGQLGFNALSPVYSLTGIKVSYMTQTTSWTMVEGPWTSLGSEPLKVAAGSNHSVVLDNLGNLYGTGCNLYGQLGLGVGVLSTTVWMKLSGTGWTDVICGGDRTFALSGNPEPTYNWYAAGHNYFGQLGIGNNSNQYNFIKIPGDYKKIKLGNIHTVALSSIDNNIVYVTGDNSKNQLGMPSLLGCNSFTQLTYLSSNIVTDIFAGYDATFVAVVSSLPLPTPMPTATPGPTSGPTPTPTPTPWVGPLPVFNISNIQGLKNLTATELTEYTINNAGTAIDIFLPYLSANYTAAYGQFCGTPRINLANPYLSANNFFNSTNSYDLLTYLSLTGSGHVFSLSGANYMPIFQDINNNILYREYVSAFVPDYTLYASSTAVNKIKNITTFAGINTLSALSLSSYLPHIPFKLYGPGIDKSACNHNLRIKVPSHSITVNGNTYYVKTFGLYFTSINVPLTYDANGNPTQVTAPDTFITINPKTASIPSSGISTTSYLSSILGTNVMRSVTKSPSSVSLFSPNTNTSTGVSAALNDLDRSFFVQLQSFFLADPSVLNFYTGNPFASNGVRCIAPSNPIIVNNKWGYLINSNTDSAVVAALSTDNYNLTLPLSSNATYPLINLPGVPRLYTNTVSGFYFNPAPLTTVLLRRYGTSYETDVNGNKYINIPFGQQEQSSLDNGGINERIIVSYYAR